MKSFHVYGSNSSISALLSGAIDLADFLLHECWVPFPCLGVWQSASSNLVEAGAEVEWVVG